MTLVAAGCPTTFCESMAARSSAGSLPGFLERFCRLFGLSTPTSGLIIAAEVILLRRTRRSPGRSGSFTRDLFSHAVQQDNRDAVAIRIISAHTVTARLHCLVPRGMRKGVSAFILNHFLGKEYGAEPTGCKQLG